MFLHAEEAEIRRGSGAHGGVPFVGPRHGHGDRVSGVNLHMHVAAPDAGIVDAAGMQAGRFQRDVLAAGSRPDNLILRMRLHAKAQTSSVAKIERFLILKVLAGSSARTLTNSQRKDYEGTKFPRGTAAINCKD